jgi:hypothetical protein
MNAPVASALARTSVTAGPFRDATGSVEDAHNTAELLDAKVYAIRWRPPAAVRVVSAIMPL